MKKPILTSEAMSMLEKILATSATRVTKTHEELLVDEVKRHILACINQQFVVQ